MTRQQRSIRTIGALVRRALIGAAFLGISASVHAGICGSDRFGPRPSPRAALPGVAESRATCGDREPALAALDLANEVVRRAAIAAATRPDSAAPGLEATRAQSASPPLQGLSASPRLADLDDDGHGRSRPPSPTPLPASAWLLLVSLGSLLALGHRARDPMHPSPRGPDATLARR